MFMKISIFLNITKKKKIVNKTSLNFKKTI